MTSNSLADLPVGHDARVVALCAERDFVKRLHALGFRIGRTVRVIRRAPLSGPVQIRIGTTDVMLRRREAGNIQIETLAA